MNGIDVILWKFLASKRAVMVHRHLVGSGAITRKDNEAWIFNLKNIAGVPFISTYIIPPTVLVGVM